MGHMSMVANAYIYIYIYRRSKNYILSNARDTNFFIKKFTNCWCDEYLFVDEKWH